MEEPPETRIHRSLGNLYRFRIQPPSLPFTLAAMSGYRSSRDAQFQNGLAQLLQQDLVDWLPGSTLCLTERGVAQLPEGIWETPCTREEMEQELLANIVMPLVMHHKVEVTQEEVVQFWRPLRDGRFHQFSKLVNPLLRQAKDGLVAYRGFQRVLQTMVDTGLATAQYYTYDDSEIVVQTIQNEDTLEYEKQRQIRVLPETTALFVQLCDCAFPGGRPQGKWLAIPTQPQPCEDGDCPLRQSEGGCWIVGTEHIGGWFPIG